ncbi:ferritin-like domain-containing protein [Ramlibacter sp.]|uniref:ferritin-like domain-containing protein n=1 Tax=Ramlibacter sp. TaxID=1917967 RepID=UPI002FCA3684
MRTARQEALAVLLQPRPELKAEMARALRADGWLGEAEAMAEPAGIPGRPAQPRLVAPAGLKRRSVRTPEGRAALIHALAHIELNAIDLAADIVWRFHGLPPLFYRQWIAIAREEALHFQLLRAHLRSLGHDYGDFPAHNGLWEMAEKTKGDLLARLALVPRTLEARGLDASPPIRARLLEAGDAHAAGILDIILRDEIGHVRVGNHWYRLLCAERGLDPVQAYAALAARHGAPRLRGPFNLEARRRAGFEEAELAVLAADDGMPSTGEGSRRLPG